MTLSPRFRRSSLTVLIVVLLLGGSRQIALTQSPRLEYRVVFANAREMGDTRQAVSWLRKATREGLPCYPLFERDSDLDNLRHDQEFVALMAELKAQHERFRSLF